MSSPSGKSGESRVSVDALVRIDQKIISIEKNITDIRETMSNQKET